MLIPKTEDSEHNMQEEVVVEVVEVMKGKRGKVKNGRTKGKICEICGKHIKRDFKRHEKTHTGEKSYVCTKPDCGIAFARRDMLNIHVRTCGQGLMPGRPLGSKGKSRKASGSKRRA